MRAAVACIWRRVDSAERRDNALPEEVAPRDGDDLNKLERGLTQAVDLAVLGEQYLKTSYVKLTAANASLPDSCLGAIDLVEFLPEEEAAELATGVGLL